MVAAAEELDRSGARRLGTRKRDFYIVKTLYE